MPKALITGITGQDGSHLTELLLDHGYEVHGLIRRAMAELGWKPRVSFEELVRGMVESDLAEIGLDLRQARAGARGLSGGGS